MLVVLSPSKTQDFSEQKIALPKLTTPEFLDESSELVDELRGYSKARLAKLMSISDKLAALNYERFQTFETPFTKANAKPALLAFRGDVYDGMEADNYSKKEFTFAQSHLRILSGLYGLLRPLDLIQPYRLEMKTKLKNSTGKDLYTFWKPLLAPAVQRALSKQGKDNVLVNLASNEYYSALDLATLTQGKHPTRIITPVFKEKKGSSYKVVALFAKRARGMMANHIIRNNITNVEKITAFAHDGYRYNKSLSTDTEWVFTR